MSRHMLRFMLALCFLTYGSISLADDFECKITDTDSDADLDSAGPNSRCGGNPAGPWACFCEITEECRNNDNGQTQIFHRRQFMGCGDLSDCAFNTPYGRQCKAMED